MNTHEGPLLLCTDGTRVAEHAIVRAAALFPGQPAEVVCAWRRASRRPPRTGLGAAIALLEPAEDLDRSAEQTARETVDHGAELARCHGLAVTTATPSGDDPATALLELAATVDARGLVLGRARHHIGGELLLGSVAREVTRRAGRPVFLMPDGDPPDEL